MTTQVAFLFPGQGSQAVGMGADIFATSPAARSVFEVTDEALGFSLSTLCFQGPEDVLRETINAQPAIVTVSLALLAALQEALVQSGRRMESPTLSPEPHSLSASSPLWFWTAPLTPSYTAGHSVGEYAALVASGALDLKEAILLVRERGRLMHHEGTICPGGMAAIIGMDEGKLQEICEEVTAQSVANRPPDAHPGQGRLTIANFNAPGQIVISGEQDALALAMKLAKAQGAKRVIPLAVSGAFHSPVMQPATVGLTQAIDTINVQNATIPIISNISAAPLIEAHSIRKELAQQVASSVQWMRTIEYLVDAGVTLFLEIGPGQALTGMVKRIAPGLAKATGSAIPTSLNVSNAADIEKVTHAIHEMGLLDEV